MNFQQVLSEFRIRFYQWAKADSEREINDNFSLISGIKSVQTLRILYWMQELSKHDQCELFLSRI